MTRGQFLNGSDKSELHGLAKGAVRRIGGPPAAAAASIHSPGVRPVWVALLPFEIG
jgi:hypothetical protein